MSIDVERLEQYVTFHLAGERYGIPINKVQEIIRLPEITKVPQAPEYVEGLANLRGMIVTVINGRLKFNLLTKEHDEDTRVIILALDNRTAGYIVDSISEVISVAQNEIENVPEDLPNNGCLSGLIRSEKGVILLLDAEKLVGSSYEAKWKTKEENVSDKRNLAGEKQELSEERQLVSFNVGSEEYALDIAHVQEIVGYPESLSTVPTFPYYAQGIMVLRESMLPVVSLAKLIGAGEAEDKTRSRVVVLTSGGNSAGLGMSVDSVSEVLRVREDSIGELPEYLVGSGNIKLTGVCKLDGGKRLVYLLDPDFLLSLNDVKLVSQKNDGEANFKLQEASDHEGQFIVFKLAGQVFMTEISSVREILNVPEIFAVPQAPGFVEGVINIRGRIIPVVDLRRRLDLGYLEREEQNRIVVVELDGSLTGFIVDAVKEVKKIPLANIEPPDVLSGVGLDFAHVVGIAKLNAEGLIAMVLDLKCLLSGFERKILSSLTREGEKGEVENPGVVS
ncbi:chemotaxis protein CheW [Zhaonella formicivorans]|uniref:chemotaxis protein CheW n=1 Tax=Zhaonella formicivorans TaxID=2528593 RepID=UPI0010F2BD41|nr:chemotaxis protein CheW [Zhaonella formicivorans]